MRKLKNSLQTLLNSLNISAFGIFHYFLIFICGLLMSAIFCEIMSVNFSLPVAECDLSITSKSQYGIVSGSWFAGMILTAYLWGLLSDLYGRRNILTVTPIIGFMTAVASSFSTHYLMLAVFRFFNGICMSSAGAVVFAYLGEFLTTRNRSRSIMIASIIFGIISTAFPISAYFIINQNWKLHIEFLNIIYKPWRLFVLMCGLPSLICGIAFIFLPESPKFCFSKGQTQKSLKILNQIYFLNTRKSDFKVKDIQLKDEFIQASSNPKGVLRMMLHNTLQMLKNYPRSFWLLSIIQFGTFYVCHGLLLFFPDILHEVSQFSESSSSLQLCDVVDKVIAHKTNLSSNFIEVCVDELDISAYTYVTILQSCFLVGFLVISFTVNYIGRFPILIFIFLTTGLCGILIAFIKNATVATYLYLWLLVSGVNSNLLNTVSYDLFPTNLRSMAISTTMLFGRLGGLAGGNVASILLEKSCNWTFGIGGILLVLCGVLVIFIPNIFRRKEPV
ncbi:hypothetical protein ACKWTF_013829 [Chironomus riparius]